MAVDRWFRFYEEAINHDKVRGLASDTLRWQWVTLLAVASKYGGVIPSLKVAALNLNVKESKAAQVIATLHRAELLDCVDGGYFKPHDWHGRQPVDATAAERKRRQRQKERDDRDSHAVTTVTCHGEVTPTEIRDESKIGGGGDARAREPAKQPWELEPCHDLARRLAEIAKRSDEFEFTGWGGATYRVKQWLADGWPEELIVAAVREAAGKSAYVPPNGIKYFEPIIARFIAQQTAPLPKVVEIQPKTVEVSNGKTAGNSAAAAAKRLEADIRRQLAENGLDNEPYQPTYLRLPAG